MTVEWPSEKVRALVSLPSVRCLEEMEAPQKMHANLGEVSQD
jgi:hypothetical protein